MAVRPKLPSINEILKGAKRVVTNLIPPVAAYRGIKQITSPDFGKRASDLYNKALELTPQAQFSKIDQVKTGFAPLDYLSQKVGAHARNYYYQPLKDLPRNIKTTFDESASPLDRGAAAFQTAITPLAAIPDPTDVLFAAYGGAKGFEASRGQPLRKRLDVALKSATSKVGN